MLYEKKEATGESNLADYNLQRIPGQIEYVHHDLGWQSLYS